jgi:hypothetical protein
MAKAVQITDKIQSQLNAAAGTEVDPNAITVFEAAAVSTKPLNKKGSFFDKAEISRSTLVAMADAVNNQTVAVPLHTLHLQGEELPVGKVFVGDVMDNADGSSQLNVLFYLPNDTQSHLIADINNAVIDEVSVGVRFQNALCSECGWNYYGPDASFMNIFDGTCANDHVLGENGVHLNLVGLENWLELSLVSRGAAKNAKILGRAKRSLAASDIEKMAASGRPLEASLVITNSTLTEQEDMDLSTVMTQLSEKSANLALAEKARDDATASLAAANTTIADLNKKLADLEAASGDQAKKLADLKVAEDFLTDQAKKGLVASGKADTAVADTVAGRIEQIQAAQVNLHQLPVGGKSESSDASADGSSKAKNYGSFKTRS